MSLSKKWTYASCIFLIVAMCIGTLLRFSFISIAFEFDYKYVLHTHSHIILLGWVFNAICALIYHYYKSDLNPTYSLVLFVLFQVTIVGMLLSFPVQGYALYSIIFSTSHIFVSYFFIGHVLAKLKTKSSIAERFIKLSFFYFIISTFGPFALGYIQSRGMTDSPLYNLSIYYYLHFLYNGFFILALIGLVLKSINPSVLAKHQKDALRSYYFIGYSVFPAYALSAFCAYRLDWIYGLGILSGITQLIGFFFLVKFFLGVYRSDSSWLKPEIKLFLLPALIGLGIKSILQLFSAFPFLSDVICNNHNLIIAYLHLIFIGILTLALIGLLKINELISINKTLDKVGLGLVLFGFLFSEIVLVYPSLSMWFGLPLLLNYYYLLFAFSCLILVGTIVLTIRIKKSSTHF